MFSDPVVGYKFFGRHAILNLLSKRVNGLKDGFRQNIACVGPKLIGKSSSILHFLSGFNSPAIIPVYIDLRPNSFNHFACKLLGTMLYYYLKNRNLALEGSEKLEILKEHARNTIPKTVAAIEIIEGQIKNAENEQAYQALLKLSALLKEESGISSILIFDEFHLLDTYRIRKPFMHLAKEIMLQTDTMYILISSQVSYAKRIFANELSLLFGNFEMIHFEPFDYETCCSFLAKRFQDIQVPGDMRDFLILFSERHPFYLDILSNKLLEKTRELNKTEIDAAIFGRAFNSLIYDSRGILNQYFNSMLAQNLNGRDYSDFLPILLFACERGFQVNEISKAIKRHPKFITKQINCLLEKDLLAKAGPFYRIRDKIFRFWLKSVYQRKNLSFSADPNSESRDFSREIEEAIGQFSQTARKSPTEKATELFKSFNNEIVTLQNKSFRFWNFETVNVLDSQFPNRCITARYADGCWVCLIGEEQLNEADIQEFFHFCKKSEKKITRKIILDLKPMDLNLRLAALEKRFWIWSRSDFNLLLDLYGKQQIVK